MKGNGTKLELHFSSCDSPELIKTVFENPKIGSKIVGQRSLGLLPNGTVSFKWTPCSQALAMFLVNAKVLVSAGNESTPILEGFNLSPAASLGARLWKRDYAWIHDIFGTEKDGTPILRHLIIGINVRQKTKAPVQLFLRTSFLPVEQIRIFVGGNDISDSSKPLQSLSAKLSKLWAPGDNGQSSFSEKEVISGIEKRLAA